jgi:hypothetical protein
VTAALQNRHAVDADLRQSVLHVIQLVRLDDCFYFLQACLLGS